MADMLALAALQYGELNPTKFGHLETALVLLLTEKAGQSASLLGMAGVRERGRKPRSTQAPNMGDEGTEELAQRALAASLESQRAGLDTGGRPLSVGLAVVKTKGSESEACMTFVWLDEEGRDRARASFPLLLRLARFGAES